MGSELGTSSGFLEDVIWLGLPNVLVGNLRKLRIGAHPGIKALAFLPGVYLMMRLQLEIAGFEVKQHFYDWRQNIKDLGTELKRKIQGEPEPVMVIAHSMGGLVTRAAFKQGLGNVSKFIMLATPNHGSLAPVEAMRGQFGLARLIAGFDLPNTSEDLATEVFSTFPGLYQMILQRSFNDGYELLESENWPKAGPKPDKQLLNLAKSLGEELANPEEHPDISWYLIAGAGLATKISARLDGDVFKYEVTDEGDGTVPLKSARLPGIKKTWYAAAEHGFFTNHGGVRAATIDILKTGDSSALPTQAPSAGFAPQWVTENDFRNLANARSRAIDSESLSHYQRTRILFGSPEVLRIANVSKAVTPAAEGVFNHPLDNVTIGRKKQRRLEICFYNGSITDVDARAYVLGTFTGVTPSGAANALDDLMGGAIRDIIGHNMFGSHTGEIFILPLARRMIRAETAVFVGLGTFDEYHAMPVPETNGSCTQFYMHPKYVPMLEIAAENVARTLARTHLDEIATVVLGGTVSGDMKATSESLLRGLLRGLYADKLQSVRRVTICETNVERFNELRLHLVKLATSPLCENIEFVLMDMEAPPEVARLRALGVSLTSPSSGPEPAYLIVRSDPPGSGTKLTFRYTVLGLSSRATVREPEPVEIEISAFNSLLKAVEGDRVPTVKEIETLGKAISATLMPEEIREQLRELRDYPLVLLHDNGIAARVPWETIQLDRKGGGELEKPAINKGISRRFIASSADCKRWSTIGSVRKKLRVLLISNPTEDLYGADEETKAIKALLFTHSGSFSVDDSLSGANATKENIIRKLKEGNYDIVHYSGHAFFNPKQPGRGGFICAGNQELTGADLAEIPQLPFLLIANACQSGKMRKAPAKGPKIKSTKPSQAAAPRTIAETMLCSGISNFIGTYWPVSDDTAGKFASTLYTSLLADKTLGAAMVDARHAIENTEDWPNYIFYGNRAAKLNPQ